MKNAKWVVGIRPMKREFSDWYGQRGWSKEGLVRTMSRIDGPLRDSTLSAQRLTVAGIAYAGRQGIARVEVSADDGQNWQDAQLRQSPPAGSDQWLRWTAELSVPRVSGVAVLARATDGTGELQEQTFALPQPNGGTGWPRIELKPT